MSDCKHHVTILRFDEFEGKTVLIFNPNDPVNSDQSKGIIRCDKCLEIVSMTVDDPEEAVQ